MFRFPPNQKYSGKIYEERNKEGFINDGDFEEGTKVTYRSLFKSTFAEENRLGKDLGEFTLDEISNVLYNLEPLSVTSCKGKLAIIESYIRWAMKHGIRSNQMNPLDMAPSDYAEQFVNKNTKKFFSRDEIYEEIIPKLANYQDKVLLALLFDGVEGHDFSEVRFLRKRDVNFDTGELFLTNHKQDSTEQRTLEVSEECLKIIEGAIDERVYEKDNGRMRISGNNKLTQDHLPLIETGYVVKISKSNTAELGEARSHVIRNRLKTIKSCFDNIDILTPQNIVKSGQIYIGYLLLKRDGVLDKEQYIEICERYNMSKIENKSGEYYPWSRLKEYVNLENIKRLYKEDEELEKLIP